MATDQPTGARYPAVVALLRRQRGYADGEGVELFVSVVHAESILAKVFVPEDRAYWERYAARCRDLIEQRRELVRQIDTALAALEGASDGA